MLKATIVHCLTTSQNHIRPDIKGLFISVLLSDMSCPAFKKIIRNAKVKKKKSDEANKKYRTGFIYDTDF